MNMDGAQPISSGATADVYAYDEGRVVKLFRERAEHNTNEIRAARVAADAGLPTPRVWGDALVDIDGRDGITFDRVDGVTMHQYVVDRPDEAEATGCELGELQARVHACEADGLHDVRPVLAWSIEGAQHLDADTRVAVAEVLESLPDGTALCHNDLHPMNVLRSDDRWVAIDWAAGMRGNRLAGHARSWLLSRYWLGGVAGGDADTLSGWGRFWRAYSQRYTELMPTPVEELRQWQTVIAAVSLAWDRTVPHPEKRVEFIAASLEGRPHLWVDDMGAE